MTKSKRIRITGSGIYGAPTANNPTGELPIGLEFDVKGDIPAGWRGRAVVVGDEPAEGSCLIGNEADDERIEAARKEVAEEAQKFIDNLRTEHETALKVQTDRADEAEKALADANAEIARLKEEAAFATPVEIKMAVALLDKADDTHWTGTGLPAVDAVKGLVGKDVSRDQITAVAPDAKRPAA